MSTTALGLLSIANLAVASSPFLNKRFDNSSSTCETVTSTSTQLVSIYGPSYTGTPVSELTAPVIEGEWSNGPVWSIIIPQTYLESIGIELFLESAEGVSFSAQDYTMYTGDFGDFFYPGAIYSTSDDGINFEGKTDYPLIKIVIDGSKSFDSDASSFLADFSLYVSSVPSSLLTKRDTLMYELKLAIDKPTENDETSTTASTATPEVTSAPGSTHTVIVGSTTTETITSCSDHVCSESVITAVGSVVTVTEGNIVTSYTTYCPLPTEEAPVETETTKPETETETTKPETEAETETSKPKTEAETAKPKTEAETETTKPETEAETAKPKTEAPATEHPTTATETKAPGTTTTEAPIAVQPTTTYLPTESDVSIYSGAANKPLLNAGALGAFVLGAMML